MRLDRWTETAASAVQPGAVPSLSDLPRPLPRRLRTQAARRWHWILGALLTRSNTGNEDRATDRLKGAGSQIQDLCPERVETSDVVSFYHPGSPRPGEHGACGRVRVPAGACGEHVLRSFPLTVLHCTGSRRKGLKPRGRQGLCQNQRQDTEQAVQADQSR